MSIIKQGKYRHYKGNLYEVTAIARSCETLEDMVIYQALYGDFGLYVRPLKMFLEDVEVNGEIQKRFEFVEDEETALAGNNNALSVESQYKICKAAQSQVEVIKSKITIYNNSKVPFTQEQAFINLNFCIKDNNSAIIAGITSRLYCWGMLFVDILVVDEKYYKNGLGSKLLSHVENEAKKLGATLAHLDTFDFQAKDFYIKHGYEVFGVLDDCPKGHKRYYMKKLL